MLKHRRRKKKRILWATPKALLLLLLLLLLLYIFFIYISNAIPKVPYTLPPPCSPTHPLPLFGPGVPPYWGI
jgi:energy-coupling factor transporter transmembrane protein EcfT